MALPGQLGKCVTEWSGVEQGGIPVKVMMLVFDSEERKFGIVDFLASHSCLKCRPTSLHKPKLLHQNPTHSSAVHG